MSTPPPAGDDLETVARAIYESIWADDFPTNRHSAEYAQYLQAASNALEAVRSTREGEIERLRKALVEAAIPLEGLLLCRTADLANLAEHVWAEIENGARHARQALNKGTNDVG